MDFLTKKIIGITGGIGSGKSTVAKFIEERGFPVYNSDFWAKEIVNFDENLKSKIKNLLGEIAYSDGKYDRKFVAAMVFNDENLLRSLNQIIHPAVKNHFENWVSGQNSEFVFKETALLFELRLNENCYKTILVTADEEIRIRRAMERDGRSREEILAIISRQMPESEKIKLADFVIQNNASLQALETETFTVLEQLS